MSYDEQLAGRVRSCLAGRSSKRRPAATGLVGDRARRGKVP
jgi:hypothetical protein